MSITPENLDIDHDIDANKPVWYSFMIYNEPKHATRDNPMGATLTHLMIPEPTTQGEAIADCMYFWEQHRGDARQDQVKLFVAKKRVPGGDANPAHIVKGSMIQVDRPKERGMVILSAKDPGRN